MKLDFLVVPTVSFQVLYVFIVLGHDRRRAIHFNVTSHPTAEWTARQIAEAFPWDSAPRYLLHDRDYFEYYECSRTHLALEKDAPECRAIQSPDLGKVVELGQVGGLHHRYERRAA